MAPTMNKDADHGEFTMTWDVSATDEVRAVLATRGTLEDSGRTQKFYGLGPVLVNGRLIFVLTGLPDSAGDAWAMLRSARQPGPAPPPKFLERQEKVGGAAGLGSIVTTLTGGNRRAIATYQAEISLDAKLWRGPVPRSADAVADARALRLGNASVDQVGYRFVESVGGLSEVSIVFLHDEQTHKVNVTARGPVKVEADFSLPVIVDACDLVLAHLFCPVEVADDTK